MTVFVVLFEDDSAREEMRQKHMEQHLSFLADNATVVSAAGPLVSADGVPAGGLWLVKADGFDAVRMLYQRDPFWPTGLRKSVRVLEWRRVFADGRRLI